MARRKGSKIPRGGAAAAPRGPSRVEHAWARDIAARSDRFAAPLLRRRAGMPGLGVGAFSRAVRRGLVMPRALVRPRLATAAPADRARPALPFLSPHAEMGLSHHHLYTLLAWLASRYDAGGEHVPGVRPGRATLSGRSDPSFAYLEALLSASARPASVPMAARGAGQPRVPAAPRTTHGVGTTAGFVPVPAALRFAQSLSAIAGLVPVPADTTRDGQDTGDLGMAPPYGSIIAGPWLATRARRAAARVPVIRPPAEMVRSPQVMEQLSAASGDATPTAPRPGARREPAPSRRTLAWSAVALGDDQPGRHRDDQPGRRRVGAAPPNPLVWRPTFPTIGALSLAAGFDSSEAVPEHDAPAAVIRQRLAAPTMALPASFGLSPGIRRMAVAAAATPDRQQRGAAWIAGMHSPRRAAPAPGAGALALSPGAFIAPDAVRARAPIGLAVLGQTHTFQPPGAAPRGALVGGRPAWPGQIMPGGADSVADAGFGAVRTSRSRPDASATPVAAAAAPARLGSRAARAHPLPSASALAPVARPTVAPDARPALVPVAPLRAAPSQRTALSQPAAPFGLTVAQVLPVAFARPALWPMTRVMPVMQGFVRVAAPVLAPGATPLDLTLALVPAAVRAYVEDDSLVGSGAAWLPSGAAWLPSGAAWLPTGSAQNARASAAGVTPGTWRDRSATTAGVTPGAVVRSPTHGPTAPDAAMAPSLTALTAPPRTARMGRHDRQRAVATPFAALSRTLALVARIQHAPGARSLRAFAAAAGVPPALLSGALPRGHGLVPANAQAGLPRGTHNMMGDAGWSAPTGAGTPAFAPGVPAFAPGHDIFLRTGTVWPHDRTSLPDRALAHTLPPFGPVPAHTFTPPDLVSRGILSEPAAGGILSELAAGGIQPAAIAREWRRPNGFHLAAARYAVDDRAGVPALSVQRRAAPPPAAVFGATRVAGEPASGTEPPLWRYGVSDQSFADRGVVVRRPTAITAAWQAAVTEPPELGVPIGHGAPTRAPVSRLALSPAARLALATTSRLDALPFGIAAPHTVADPSLSRLMPQWRERAGLLPDPVTRGRARRLRAQEGSSRVDYAQALPSPLPALLPLLHAVPVAQRLTVGMTSSGAIPALTPVVTAATLALAPVVTAFRAPAAGIGAIHGAAPAGVTSLAGLPTAAMGRPLMRGAPLPDAAVALPPYPSLFTPVTAGWRIPGIALPHAGPRSSAGAGWKPSVPGGTLAQPTLPGGTLVQPSYMHSPGYAPEDQRAPSGTARVAPVGQRIGGRAEVAAPFVAPSRSLPVAAWARRLSGAMTGDTTPRGRGRVSPNLLSLAGQVAAPGMRLSALRAVTQDDGMGRALAGMGRAGTGPVGSVGYGADAIMDVAGGDSMGHAPRPVGGASPAPLLSHALAPLSRFLSPARLAAAARPLARGASTLLLSPRSLVTAAPAARPALLIQRKALAGAGEPSPLQRGIAVARAAHSTGRPLDSPARALMETALSRDLAPIQLHTDAPAGQAAAAVGARAFTLGRDVFFAPGAYQPHSPAGLALLGHELVHTGQQQAAVQRHGAAGMAAISTASEPRPLEEQAARTESSLLSLFSARSVPVARQAAEPSADGLAAWTPSLAGHTTAPALSLSETPRALYHQPVTAIQRAGNLFGAVRPTAPASAPSARAPLLGAARGRSRGAAAHGPGGTALPGIAPAAAPAEQHEAAQAAMPGVEDLVAQVLRRVKQELRLDHERAGGFLSDLMR